MKKSLFLIVFLVATNFVFAQSDTDRVGVERACLNYLEGFYEGDTLKLIASLQPSLYKLGFWKDKTTGKYKQDGYMTFEQAKNYAKNVLAKKNFPKADAPKKVEVLDILPAIAAAKVTGWWGVDYMLLSKTGDKWMIEEVLWQGPLEKNVEKN